MHPFLEPRGKALKTYTLLKKSRKNQLKSQEKIKNQKNLERPFIQVLHPSPRAIEQCPKTDSS